MAVLVVRFFMPVLTRRLGERGVMISAMVLSGITFIGFAFAHNYSLMLSLTFVIGLGEHLHVAAVPDCGRWNFVG